MQGYNVIMLYNAEETRLLMCTRSKAPYLGMKNFVGGKIEPGERGEDAAYRELWEETGVGREDVRLVHVMDFTYYLQGCYVEVYAGRLVRPVDVHGSENALLWSGLDEDFFDTAAYAGEGNIGHMVEQVRLYAQRILRS